MHTGGVPGGRVRHGVPDVHEVQGDLRPQPRHVPPGVPAGPCRAAGRYHQPRVLLHGGGHH